MFLQFFLFYFNLRPALGLQEALGCRSSSSYRFLPPFVPYGSRMPPYSCDLRDRCSGCFLLLQIRGILSSARYAPIFASPFAARTSWARE